MKVPKQQKNLGRSPSRNPQRKTQRNIKKPGLLITFEGTEGAGKTTLINKVSTLLKSRGLLVTETREPGGSPLAEDVRTLILNQHMAPRTELLLYEAARSEHLAAKILPALNAGHIVLCDRFTDSTLAYQGMARGLPWKEIKILNNLATDGLTPNLTFFLDLPPEIGLQRAQDPNRFEREGVDFQRKVRAGYLKARKENASRWITLKVTHKTPEQLAQTVLKRIISRFKSLSKKG